MKMSEKVANLQRTILREHKKAWRTIALDHVKKNLPRVWLIGNKIFLKKKSFKMGNSGLRLRIAKVSLDRLP